MKKVFMKYVMNGKYFLALPPGSSLKEIQLF